MSILGNTAAGDPTVDNSGVQPAPITGGIVQAAAQTAPVQSTPSQQPTQQQPAPTNSPSRLSRILSAVANVGATALAGIPDTGRPSFVTGLGEGARAEKQQEANQAAIKFKTFDDQVRAAQLHNQDLEIQARTQAQADAHQAAQDTQHDWDEAHGIQYQTIPNSGQAATDYLTAQSGNGGASIPPGTHLSADGKSILIPKQSDETQSALLKKYQTFSSAYNLPSLPDGAQFVPGKFVDYLQNKLEGKNLDGSVIKHDDIPGAIADLQTTRANLAKNANTDPAVLSQIDGTIGHLKENQKALDDHQASVFKTQQAQQLDTLNKSEAIKAKYKEQEQDNAAGDKGTGDSTLGYAYDPKNDQTVAVTADQAKAQGFTTFRKVNQTQIAGDTHNASVLNDVSSKTNAVIQSASALDQPQKQRDIISWALGDNGIKIGFGDHLALPMDALVNNSLNSRNMGQASDQTKQYIIGVLSLREAAMGMNRVLTGSARASETQIKALQATLPGYEPDSKTALQRLQSFSQNVDQLRKPIPVIPGVPRTQITFGQPQQQTTPSGGSNLSQMVSGNATDIINGLR